MILWELNDSNFSDGSSEKEENEDQEVNFQLSRNLTHSHFLHMTREKKN